MKPTLVLLLAVAVLLITAHRLPAPIIEETPQPHVTAKPRATAAKRKDTESAVGARRLDGTWRATSSTKFDNGNSMSSIKTLVIKNGSVAEWTGEKTGTLAPGRKWLDLPEPYNSISPLYLKWTNKSTVLKLEGSNLRIQWPADSLTDWAPKTIPYGVLSKLAQPPVSDVYILNGDQLIGTDGKSSYTRVR